MRLHPPLVQGTVNALREIFQKKQYADRVLERLFRQNRRWGKRDRAFIAENVYDIVRWWRALWAWGFGESDLSKVTFGDEELVRLLGINLILKGEELPDWTEFVGLSLEVISRRKKEMEDNRAIAQSIPDWLDELASGEIGADWDAEITALNQQASVVLRVNTLKTELPALKKALADADWESDETDLAPDALVLRKRGNIFTHPLFKKGHFEVQDAGSQCIAPFLGVEPGMRVVDACAGAGGKALHLAALMKNKGSLIALDTEEWKLNELRKRARRNGVHIVQTRPIASSKVIKRQKNSADRLLLDVPCTGLGVLRRNPDAKWKLSPEFLERVRVAQADILQRYSQMLKPGGRLVYATCSILPSENELQVKSFLEKNEGFKFLAERKISPAKDGFDGFYMALVERKT